MDIAASTSFGSEPLALLFAAQPPAGRASHVEGLTRLREQARASFLAHGLPTKRDENWRYTDLKRLRGVGFRPVAEIEVSQSVNLPATLLPPAANGLRLVFVNGAFRDDLSQTNCEVVGVSVQSLAAAIELGELTDAIARSVEATPSSLPLVALNTALFEDGLLIIVEPRACETVWIEAVFFGGAETPIAYAPRHCVSVGAGSRVVLIERHASATGAEYFADQVLQADLQPDAVLCHYRTVACGQAAANVMTTAVSVGSGAKYESVSLIGRGGLNRIETQVELKGSAASCTVSAAYHAAGDDLCDNTTLVEHAAPKTASRQVFRGVIDDAAHAVFQGRVLVAPGADEADGHQLSKALLLSDSAEIDQKPALEIYADNVKCSHGAAAGSLDKGALFYLRSRGLDETAARRLLIEGFLAEALQEISIEEIRVALQERAAADAQTTRQSEP